MSNKRVIIYIIPAWICFTIISCNSGEKKIVKQPEPTLPAKTTEVLRDDVNAIQVRLNNSNSAMINSVIVDSIQVKSQLRLAKKEKGDTATVVLRVKGDTDFGMFATVHKSLEELLIEERDSVARLRFNTIYENLSGTQQAIIMRRHHLRIIEKMRR